MTGAELGEHAALKKAWPGVVEAANLIGSKQVQGRATMTGNLCNASPAADSVPALVAAGAKVAIVGPALAAAFQAGDSLIVVQESGDLLHVPAAVAAVARTAIDRAQAAFFALAEVSDTQINDFFERFAALLSSEAVWAEIAAANVADLERALA